MTWLSKETVGFLNDLAANNRRDWFQDNKARYEAALKRPAAVFSEAMAAELAARTGCDYVAKVYRIFRDVRFSADKTPYNAHLHVSFTTKTDGVFTPAWLFGLEPERLVLGVGQFGFKGAELDTWRQRVAGEAGAVLQSHIDALAAKDIRCDPPELKRVPAPYDKDHPRADLLRRKGFCVFFDATARSDCFGPDGPGTCADALMPLKPVFDWLVS